MSGFQVGEHVKITIEGRITATHPDPDDLPEITVLLDCEIGSAPIRIPHCWPMVTIERVAPPEWPPQHKDEWTDRDGDAWYGVLVDTNDAVDEPYVELWPSRTSKHRHDLSDDRMLIDRYGPFTLVRRENTTADRTRVPIEECICGTQDIDRDCPFHLPAITTRPWTPNRKKAGDDGREVTVVVMKRCCNGCGRKLGDVYPEEIEASVSGQPLPDVRNECPNCGPAQRAANEGPYTVGPVTAEAAAVWGHVHVGSHVTVHWKDGGSITGKVLGKADDWLLVDDGDSSRYDLVPTDIDRVEMLPDPSVTGPGTEAEQPQDGA